jgi:hypothetical protein
MKIAALVIRPTEDDRPEVIRTELPASVEEFGPAEPEYGALKELIGGWVEHVGVARGIDVWCDEEFRLKGSKPTALIRGERGEHWDFGGTIVITGPSREKLLAWSIERLSLLGPGAKLSPGSIRISTVDAEGNEKVVYDSGPIEPGEAS